MPQVEVTITDTGVYAEQGGEMLPVPCQWFALCTQPATMTRPHPTLGDVPICTRCNETIERLST